MGISSLNNKNSQKHIPVSSRILVTFPCYWMTNPLKAELLFMISIYLSLFKSKTRAKNKGFLRNYAVSKGKGKSRYFPPSIENIQVYETWSSLITFKFYSINPSCLFENCIKTTRENVWLFQGKNQEGRVCDLWSFCSPLGNNLSIAIEAGARWNIGSLIVIPRETPYPGKN